MDRKEFLKQLGLTSAVIFAGACMGGCSKDDSTSPGSPNTTPPTTTGTDFTLNLTEASNAALKTAGGYLYKNGIIIAKTLAGSFIAVSQTCTHQGGIVEFQANNNRLYCPVHGAMFQVDGAVLAGPATSALTTYKTTLTGNNLRIYS